MKRHCNPSFLKRFQNETLLVSEYIFLMTREIMLLSTVSFEVFCGVFVVLSVHCLSLHRWGKTPLDEAVHFGHHDVVTILQQYRDTYSPSDDAHRHESVESRLDSLLWNCRTRHARYAALCISGITLSFSELVTCFSSSLLVFPLLHISSLMLQFVVCVCVCVWVCVWVSERAPYEYCLIKFKNILISVKVKFICAICHCWNSLVASQHMYQSVLCLTLLYLVTSGLYYTHETQVCATMVWTSWSASDCVNV